MEILIQDGWIWFCITFGLMLFIVLLMHQQSRFFYTKDVVERKFSIMDLELPSSPHEIVNIVRGIFLLPAGQTQKTLKALRAYLYLDYFFMPVAYGSIFILCYQAAAKMSNLGYPLFSTLAWLQVVAWICDIVENVYLLQRLNADIRPSTRAVHSAYQAMEIIKYGIVLTGVVCSVFGFIYFWLVGNYSYFSLHYLVIIVAEILLFVIGGKLFYEKSKVDKK